MKLYFAPTSPYARKVAVLIAEAGLSDVEIVSVYGTPIDPGSMPVGVNPLGKLPALELEDGEALFDSRVICRYLDEKAGGVLYPEGEALWPVLRAEAAADGILDAAILMVYEARLRPEDKQFAPWVDGQWAKITRTIAVAETEWLDLLSGPLTMASVAMGCALGYIDFRHPDRDWRADAPKLAAWFAAFDAGPAMANSRPPEG